VATLDNREATIQQGVTIPFETTSSLGTTTIFIDATLTLKVTPHITADRSVIMKITVERNAPDTSIDTQGAGPAISKRSAITEVLVKDRETTVIGGIFEVTDTVAIVKVPFLGDIPGIGWLFRRRSVDQDKSELLVFITPKVMTPPPQI
jgi:type IV pilus assembly protein PilQ